MGIPVVEGRTFTTDDHNDRLGSATDLIWVENWFEELRQRVGNWPVGSPGFASSWKAW